MKSIYLPLLVLSLIFASCSDDGEQLLDIINDELPEPEPGQIDTDGDGVLDTDEANHGTDSSDPCSFILASQTVAPSAEWNDADCDEDGVSNSVEVNDATDPLIGDTDGDGVNDGVEKKTIPIR